MSAQRKAAAHAAPASWRVVWECDVDAATAEEAARVARALQTGRGAPLVFSCEARPNKAQGGAGRSGALGQVQDRARSSPGAQVARARHGISAANHNGRGGLNNAEI